MSDHQKISRKRSPIDNVFWRYGPLVAWMGFIFFASTGTFSGENTSRIIRPLVLWLFPNISEETLALVHVITRKTAHFLEYALLGLLAGRAFANSPGNALRRNWILISSLLVAVYAFSDEYHQGFVQGRGASVYDSFIDIAGGVTAIFVYWLWRNRRLRRNTDQSN